MPVVPIACVRQKFSKSAFAGDDLSRVIRAVQNAM